ncbi:hypothetical protein OAM92_01455 [Acidimicrobiales bacterium]|nr:hypothetical protein [Acidimicrobiales bacterium]
MLVRFEMFPALGGGLEIVTAPDLGDGLLVDEHLARVGAPLVESMGDWVVPVRSNSLRC